ncbi:unnamed protein product [Closterium sp. NIES-65]|nr:unnamed protein product [Closterium sp. NIES-65]
MASPNVLTFDAEGRAVDFEVWVDDLQQFLQCNSKHGVSLFDLTPGAFAAPAADADNTVRSQWTTRNAAARLAIRSHLPSVERAHFSQYKTTGTLYDTVVARYSSPATAALSRLMLPYLFPDLAPFATVANLITHLRTSDTRYCVALPAEICAANPPLFGRRCVSLLVGGTAARGARGARVLEETAGATVVAVEAAERVGVEVGVVAGVGASVAVVEVDAAEAAAMGVEAAAAAAVGVAAAVVLVGVALCSAEALVVVSANSSSALVRPCRPSSFVTGTLCVGGLGVLVPALTFSATATASGVAIFDLDYDAILAAMYAVSISAEGDCYMCVPPYPGIEAAALGASESAAPGAGETAAPSAGESALSGTTSAQAFHTFTLDSGASGSFFRDCTTLSPQSRPVAVSLADPSGGPVLAHSSTVLPCPAVPSGSRSGLHLPLFSTNLVAASGQVFAAASRSGLESAPCSSRLLSHQTPLRGHPSLPRLRGMASHVLVTGLPPSLRTCVPCVEGRQRAAPYSSELPPTEAPLQTLHMDVWGPARVCGQGHECYFLLVVNDFSRYTTVFPLRRKDEVTEVLIDWIRAARRQLSESFGSDLPELRLHFDRGGEFSSDLLQAFCRAEGIRQTFPLLASPQQNGIAERRICMVIDVARTSMIHAAAPHFLWPFAVQYAAHQINLQPRLSPRAVPCAFLGFPPDAPGWQFYHPTSRRVLSSHDVTFDESVPYYHFFPYRTATLPPPRRSSLRQVLPR